MDYFNRNGVGYRIIEPAADEIWETISAMWTGTESRKD